MYLKWWSQKFGKHQVKSPCSSSTIYAYTQFHQPHIKTAIKLCHVHSTVTSWKTRSFKLHHHWEILLQSKGIFMDICEAAACRHSMWMQVFASSPISTLLTGIICGRVFFSLPLPTAQTTAYMQFLYSSHTQLLEHPNLEEKSLVFPTRDIFSNTTQMITY